MGMARNCIGVAAGGPAGYCGGLPLWTALFLETRHYGGGRKLDTGLKFSAVVFAFGNGEICPERLEYGQNL